MKEPLHRWSILVVTCVLYFLVILLDYLVRGEVNQIYCIIFLISAVVLALSIKSAQDARRELESKILELEMSEIYGDTYKELIREVQRKQHDFSNQLTAIYSMHITSTTMEELIEKQKEYGDVLLRKSRYDKILFGCENPILAGYLYYRCVSYEKSNVQVDYQIHVKGAECRLSLQEVIEILGILLTNAFEHYKADDREKRIGLKVREGKENLAIEVSNKTEVLPNWAIEKIFNEGYSSKGENRGIGLTRIKQLIDKVKGKLIVENRTKGKSNWLHFKVVIPK